MRCSWPQARGTQRDTPELLDLMVWTVYEMAIWAGAWHPPTLPWAPPGTSPAWQATGRASCACVHKLSIASILRCVSIVFVV